MPRLARLHLSNYVRPSITHVRTSRSRQRLEAFIDYRNFLLDTVFITFVNGTQSHCNFIETPKTKRHLICGWERLFDTKLFARVNRSMRMLDKNSLIPRSYRGSARPRRFPSSTTAPGSVALNEITRDPGVAEFSNASRFRRRVLAYRQPTLTVDNPFFFHATRRQTDTPLTGWLI